MDSADPASANSDFLTAFLEESGAGNSAHFATAAVLMFRYMGVPARYVEGYLVSSATETNEDGAAILRSKDAYAWAEIYRDGIGFVPFEPDLPPIPPPVPLDTNPLESEPDPPPTTTPPPKSCLWLIIPAVFLQALFMAFIVLAVRRAVKRRRLNKLFDVNDNTAAVSRITTYTIGLLAYMDISRNNGSLYMLRPKLETQCGCEMSEKYERVINVQQAALFSGQTVTDADRVCVRDFLGDVQLHLKRQVNLPRRFKLRWIKCLF